MRYSKGIISKIKLLRSRGYSLSSICALHQNIPKTTIYYWIRNVPLNKNQLKKLEEGKAKGREIGLKIRQEKKLNEINLYAKQGVKYFEKLTYREKLLVGATLYWGEGTKQRTKSPTQPVCFTNNDPKMIKVFINWLDILKIDKKRIMFALYIHNQYISQENRIKNQWEKIIPQISKWENTIYKQTTTNRKINQDYLGTVRVLVKKSTSFNRQISGLVHGIVHNFK